VSNDVRGRIVVPILVPLAIVVTMAAFIGAVAALFLLNTKGGALMLAAVAATGILFTVSLATSQDRLDAPRRVAVIVAAALPFLAGGAVAAGLVGGVADEDRMINVQPLTVIPEDVPVMAAENSLEFCLPQADGSCAPTRSWEVVPSAATETLSFLFQNLEAGVPHNVVITQLEGTPDAPAAGEVLAESAIVSGITDDYYVAETVSWDDLPEQWYFFCRVHANMNGVGSVVGATAG
jgi:hypothetical protein